MPDTDSVILVKSFTYRGATEEWSNRYHLEGTTPTTATEWDTLLAAICTSERTCYPSIHAIVRQYGYVAGNDHAVRVRDSSTSPYTGQMATTGGDIAPGDACAMLRSLTPEVTSRGRPIYLRKYFHGAIHTTGAPDTLLAAQATAILVHAGKMTDGTLPGSMKWCGPQGGNFGTFKVDPYVRYRQLRKGRRRPLA